MKPQVIADEKKLLSRAELALVIALVLPIFFLQGGPIWTHAFRIDAAVYWSYAPIPILVLVMLLRRHAWSLPGFLASTTIALAIKYMITTGIAFALWSAGDPPAIEKAPLASVLTTYEVAPKKSLDGVPRKTIEGLVVSTDGAPVAGAWVYLEGDFGAFPAESMANTPIEITVRDHELEPAVTVASRTQPLIFRSNDQSLHTVRGVARDGSPAFHYPLVPGKEPAPVRVAYASGRIALSCAVHEKARSKTPGAVILLDHPFYTRADQNGRFRLENIPVEASAPIAVSMNGETLVIR